MPYFLGIGKGLEEVGILDQGTPVAGASGGALVTASYKSGLTWNQCVEIHTETAEMFRRAGPVQGRLYEGLKTTLSQHIPEDAHERCNRSFTYIAVTRVALTRLPFLKLKLISSFATREDLIGALLASCHIPRYSSDSHTVQYRGRQHMDGGLFQLIPEPPGVTYTLRVCIMPRKELSRLPSFMKRPAPELIHITPDTFSDWPHNLQQTLELALVPGAPDFIQALVEKGVQDAYSWARSIGFTTKVVVGTALPPAGQDPRQMEGAINRVEQQVAPVIVAVGQGEREGT